MKKRRMANTSAVRKLQSDWEQLQANWRAATLPKSYQKLDGGISSKSDSFVPASPVRRDTGVVPQSLQTLGGDTNVRPSPQYTGNAVVGIATLHKSNQVPVFSKQEAVEVARMRRG
jgi:hypothetical protein